MTVSAALRPRAPRGVQAISPTDDVSTWLRSGGSRAGFTVGASIAVGVAAGFGVQTAVAALLGVALVLVVLVRPVIGAYTLIAVVPPVSGLRAGLPVPQLRLSEALIAGIGVLLLALARPGHTPQWKALDWCALGYVVGNAGLGAVALLSRGAPVTLADAENLLGPMQFFILYRAVLTTLTTAHQRRVGLRLVLMSSIPVSLLAILQEAHVPGIATLLASATDSVAFATTAGVSRATGPFAIWHDLGAYLFVIVLLGLALLVNGSHRVMGHRALVWTVLLACSALISTVTVTAIVGTAVGSLVLAMTARPRKQWVLRVAGLIGILCVAFGPILSARYAQQYAFHAPVKQTPYLPETIDFRIAVWRDLAPVLGRHLVTGYGPGIPPNLSFQFTESVYVTLVLRGGLPLLLIYASLIVALALHARGVRNDADPARRVIAQVVFLLIVLTLFMQLVTNYFVNAGFPFLLWVLAALMMGGTAATPRRRYATSVRVGRAPPSDSAPSGARAEPEYLGGVGTVLRGFAVLSSATVLMRLIGLVITTMFARYAGPETFGTYAFALALVSFVVGVPVNFGIGTLGIRRIARNPEDADKVVGEALAAQAIIAAVTVPALVVLVVSLSTDRELIRLVPLVALYYVAYSMTMDWALQGLQRLRAVATARLAGQVLFGIVTPLIMVRGPSAALQYGVMSTAGAALTAIVAFVMVRRLVGPIRVSWAIAPLWDLAKRAAPLGFSVLMIQIYYSLDQVLLGLLANTHEVGQYAAATKLPMVLSDFVVIWMSAVYPHASKLIKREPDKLRSQLGTFTSLGIVAAMPVTMGSVFVGSALMSNLFGPAYASAGPPFAILMAASAITMVSISYTSLALAAGHERTYALSVTVASIVSVLLNLLLIPFWGTVGAATARVAAELVILLICARRVTGVLGKPQFASRRIIGAVVATAVMSGALFAMPESISVWLRVVAAAGLFLVVAAACGAVRREDLALVRHGT